MDTCEIRNGAVVYCELENKCLVGNVYLLRISSPQCMRERSVAGVHRGACRIRTTGSHR